MIGKDASSSSRTVIRDAKLAEIGALGKIWYDGRQDAHAQILPFELARARTLASFERRMAAALADVRVTGPSESLLGFHMLKGDEL